MVEREKVACRVVRSGGFYKDGPWIVLDDQFTGVESTRLEIVGTACKQLPTANLLSQDSDWTGVREIVAEALLKLGTNGNPNTIWSARLERCQWIRETLDKESIWDEG